MWIEMDDVVINLDAVTSFGKRVDERYDEMLVVYTTAGSFEFYNNVEERYNILKYLLSEKYYDYDLLKM